MSVVKRWVTFLDEPQKKGRKTREWCVVPERDKEAPKERADYAELGIVRWYTYWRRYCFFPSEGTIFDAACLREIATFCDEQTRGQKEAA